MSYLQPALPVLLFLALLGLLRAWHRSTAGKRPWLVTVSVLGILILSLNPVAWLLSRPLEIWNEPSPIPAADADAFVVLAGAVASPRATRPYPLAAHDTYERLQHAAWLFKTWKTKPILVCGGGPDSGSYSQAMRHLLEIEGIPSNLIWVEARSRSTHENALYGSRILQQHGISRVALVTDARSMPRAAASFKKQGIDVVPVPIRFYDLDFGLKDLLPTWQAMESNGETIHEIGGLVWYWLRGWV
jgi:uncharacterized SAM-binding protein YcdF (DUF218 family)